MTKQLSTFQVPNSNLKEVDDDECAACALSVFSFGAGFISPSYLFSNLFLFARALISPRAPSGPYGVERALRARGAGVTPQCGVDRY